MPRPVKQFGRASSAGAREAAGLGLHGGQPVPAPVFGTQDHLHAVLCLHAMDGNFEDEKKIHLA